MTFVVYDGRYLITDRFIQFETFDRDYLRHPRTAERSVNISNPPDPLKYKLRDAQKILFPKAGTWQGIPIKAFAMAGNPEHARELMFWLETHNGDAAEYMKVQLCVPDKNDRRIYTGNNSVAFVLEGQEAVLTQSTPSSVRYNLDDFNKYILAMGSGYDVLASIRSLLTGNKPLTALESFVLASSHCSTVSHEFDYYDAKLDKYYTDQLLTDRQRTTILAKLQERVDITQIPDKTDYGVIK